MVVSSGGWDEDTTGEEKKLLKYFLFQLNNTKSSKFGGVHSSFFIFSFLISLRKFQFTIPISQVTSIAVSTISNFPKLAIKHSQMVSQKKTRNYTHCTTNLTVGVPATWDDPDSPACGPAARVSLDDLKASMSRPFRLIPVAMALGLIKTKHWNQW